MSYLIQKSNDTPTIQRHIMDKNSKIYVAGSKGLVGSAIVRKLKEDGYTNIYNYYHRQFDLRNQREVDGWFERSKPDYVFMAAAKVGGIGANNTYRGEFIYDNLAMGINVIHAAYKNGCKKLLMLGSNCIYPKNADNPISENALLTGELEHTNEPYAIAKIAAIKMCEAYREQYGFNAISAMPCNLFGIGDKYDLEKSHVLPALIRRIHEAKISNVSEIILWGNDEVRREFLFANDCAEACIFLINNYDEKEIINIGSGEDYPISEVAKLIAGIIGFSGNIFYNGALIGTPKKLLDSSKINNLGWQPKTSLVEGIKKTYQDFNLRYGSIK